MRSQPPLEADARAVGSNARTLFTGVVFGLQACAASYAIQRMRKYMHRRFITLACWSLPASCVSDSKHNQAHCVLKILVRFPVKDCEQPQYGYRLHSNPKPKTIRPKP